MSLDHWHIPTSEEEIVDVFVEEAGELLGNIDIYMKTWMNNPGDKTALTEIRRSFHTLKGSGRMVKALDLSELAWKVESMLNQAISGAVPAAESMVKLVVAVRAQIPKMVDAFKKGRSVAGNTDIESLMKLADVLAAGRKLAPLPVPLAATATVPKRRFERHEIDLKLELARCMQRADEALHRSEMALQQARRASTLNEAPNRAADQRDFHASRWRKVCIASDLDAMEAFPPDLVVSGVI